MFRRLRENGPVVLVPAAWTLVTLAHVGTVWGDVLLIAHVVMDVVLVAFAVFSWSDMTEGVLLVWKTVLLLGLAATLSGTYALARAPGNAVLLGGTVLAWMLLPAVGLAYTGERVAAECAPRVYTAGAALCLLGAALYAVGAAPDAVAKVAGLVLVGAGQTAGIVNAVVQY